MIKGTEAAPGFRVTKEKGTHPESGTIVKPAGVKSSRPRSFGDEAMEKMNRVSLLLPFTDLFRGHGFRNELGAALSAPAAGVLQFPGRQPGADLLYVHCGMEEMVGVEEVSQLPPDHRCVSPPDPTPRYPWKPAGPANAPHGRGIGCCQFDLVHHPDIKGANAWR